jgi:hypothetical protein
MLSFFVVAGPMLAYYAQNRQRVDDRPQRISIFQHSIPGRDPSWGHALDLNVLKTVGMTHVQGDSNPRHNLPNAPMFNPFWGALLALGLAWSFWTALSPLQFLLLLWWQATLIGGYFSIEAPQSYRCMDSMAPLLLIMGLGLKQILARFDRKSASTAWAFLALILIAGATLELRSYFVSLWNLPERWSAFSGDESQMGRDFKAMGAGTHALLRPDWENSWAFRFAAWPSEDYSSFDPSRDLPVKKEDLIPQENLAYILGKNYLPLKSAMKSYYPHGTYSEFSHPISGEFLYWTYVVPWSDLLKPVASSHGLTGHYYADLGGDWGTDWQVPHWQAGHLRLTRVDPFMLFHWTVAPVSERFYSVEWTGKLDAPKSGNYRFLAFSDDYAGVELDGKKVAESVQPSPGGWVEGQVNLSQGKHAIRVRYYQSKKDSNMELWWQPPQQDEKSMVPSEVLSPK